MTARFRQSMSWLHTWFGLVSGWLLFTMFVTGACGYYRHELTLWMTPELHAVARNSASGVEATRRAQEWLHANASGAEEWTILLPDERSPALRVSWRDKAAEPGGAAETLLDPHTGQPLVPKPRETRGGDFLYRLHFDLYFISPILARFIVGLCAAVLLVALVTGIIVHGRVLADLFRFRPGTGRRTWLDVHNLTGVLALPFHVAIAYSGLVCLMILLLPWGILSVYGVAGIGTFAQESFPQPAKTVAASGPAVLQRIDVMVASAEERWRPRRAGAISVDHPNDLRARVEITPVLRGALSYRKPGLVFDGVTGRQVAVINEDLSSVGTLHSAIFGFHVGHFAGPITRLVLFCLGLVGAAMIATGLTLWSMKRLATHAGTDPDGSPAIAVRLVDGLNAGIVCGLPVAIAGYLWANRLLPAASIGRAGTETSTFFWVWAIAVAAALISPSHWRWWALPGVAGAALILTPAVSALTTAADPAATLVSGPSAVAGIDLALTAAGAAFLSVFWFSARR